MGKIKVMHVIASLDIAGAETLLLNIFKRINKEKFEFYFLCYGNKKFDYEEEIVKYGGKIVKIDKPSDVGFVKFFKEICKVFKKEKFDIVHAHTFYNSGVIMLIAFLFGIKKRIVHAHTVDIEKNNKIKKKFYKKISKYLINIFANVFIACSKESAKSLFINKKVNIISNGIDIEKFTYDKNTRNKLRDKMCISEDTIVIGNVARFFESKNHKYMVKVFKEYIKINSDAILLLIGNGPLKDYIKKKVLNYGIDKNVVFLDATSNVNELYNIMDVFLFPSLFEGLGIVLIEAQTNGLKCLISDTIPKEVEITNNIIFFELEKSPKEWAKKLYNINLNRKQETKLIKESGYDINKTINIIEILYSDC